VDKEDLVKLLGPRPFTEPTSYEDLVKNTGTIFILFM